MGPTLLTVLNNDELLTVFPFAAALVPTRSTTNRLQIPASFLKKFCSFS